MSEVVLMFLICFVSDPYISVEVTQPGRPPMKQQTTALKNISNPKFNQTFTYDVSESFDDMNETSVSVSLFDHDRIRSDVLIGQIVFGSLATEICQYGHWQEMLESNGFMISKWHYLVDRGD